MILGLLLHTDGRKLSRLAVVSREWQALVERHNFARLRLNPSCLAEFPSKTRRNRHLVGYTWYCLELEKYDCGSETSSTLMLSRVDVAILASGFRNLFSLLSTWGPDNGILLDISVYSPSDSEHWMQYSPLRPDIPLDECGRGQYMEQALLPNVVDYEGDWIVGNKDCVRRLSSNVSKCFGVIGNEDSLFDGAGIATSSSSHGYTLAPTNTSTMESGHARSYILPSTQTSRNLLRAKDRHRS